MDLFDRLIGPSQILPLPVRVNLGITATKGLLNILPSFRTGVFLQDAVKGHILETTDKTSLWIT